MSKLAENNLEIQQIQLEYSKTIEEAYSKINKVIDSMIEQREDLLDNLKLTINYIKKK